LVIVRSRVLLRWRFAWSQWWHRHWRWLFAAAWTMICLALGGVAGLVLLHGPPSWRLGH